MSDVRKESKEKLLFVIQKHDSRNLHYDLRLESEGVMKSWTVPKGPSMDPKTRRLAVPTEDHSMSYNDFEGVIPEGNYGAGTVLVWDKGMYTSTKDDGSTFADSLEEGHATVLLEGEKLKGRFALIRTKRGWLFFKMKDEFALSGSDILSDKPDSVKTGRSLAQVNEQESPSEMRDFQ